MTGQNFWSGVFLINKPRGVTSFSVVSRIRRFTGIKKVGHTGTLDPFAEGLLLVCCGRATVVASYLEALDKTYRAGIEFGSATDTQDLTGEVIATCEINQDKIRKFCNDDFQMLRDAVKELEGEQFQLPPMYSAVKVNGQPLYKYARQGLNIDRKRRLIQVYMAKLLNAGCDGSLRAEILVSCSKGTYIRTLIDDLGRNLGVFAHAISLTRLRCGKYNIEQSLSPDSLFELAKDISGQDELRDHLRQIGSFIPLDDIFPGEKRLSINLEEAKKLIWGQDVARDAKTAGAKSGNMLDKPMNNLVEEHPLAFYYGDKLIALGKIIMDSQGLCHLKTERVVKNIADI